MLRIHAQTHTMHAAHMKFVRRTVQTGGFARSKTASMRHFRRATPLPRRQIGSDGLGCTVADIVLKQGEPGNARGFMMDRTVISNEHIEAGPERGASNLG